MAYDPSKDEKIHISPELPGDNNSNILIGVFSYDNGPYKVRVNRAKTDSGGQTRTGKLGGMSRSETLRVGKQLVALADNDSVWGGK